jgi:hypothetical protein
MAAPVIVQHVSSPKTSQVNTYVPVPWFATTTAGNLLVVLAVSQNAPQTTPPGWTRYVDGGLNVYANSSDRLYVFYKIAGTNEGAPSLNAAPGACYWIVSSFEVSGVDPAVPFDGVAQIVTAASGATIQPAPSITTTGADRLVLHVGGCSFNGTDFSVSPPAGTTFRWRDNNLNSGQEIIVFSEAAPTAGVVPARNMTRGAVTATTVGMTFALAAGAAVAGGGSTALKRRQRLRRWWHW